LVCCGTLPADWAEWNQQGVEAYRKGDFAESERLLLAALFDAPAEPLTLAAIHSNLAALYKRQRLWNRAESHYRRALEYRGRAGVQNADYAVTLNNLAETKRLAGDLQEAVRIYRASAAILDTCTPGCSQDRAVVHNNFGVALGESGRFTEGLRHLQTSLECKKHMFLAGHEQIVVTERNIQELLEAAGSANSRIRPTVDALEFRK
jgi:tetratricopeptide (TPR) repeat protein